MSEWQPIETAPKDGKPIIGLHFDNAWERRGDIVRCWYQPEFSAFISSCREMMMHNGWTFEDGSNRKLHGEVVEKVSHWMPLPPPPIPDPESAPPSD